MIALAECAPTPGGPEPAAPVRDRGHRLAGHGVRPSVGDQSTACRRLFNAWASHAARTFPGRDLTLIPQSSSAVAVGRSGEAALVASWWARCLLTPNISAISMMRT